MKKIFGVDLGGTTVKIGYFQGKKLVNKWEIPTNKKDSGKHILSDIVNSIKEYMTKNDIETKDLTGLGIGVPGPVSKNVVNKCVNLGWGVVDIEKEFATLMPGVKVIANNDANVAAAGEHWIDVSSPSTSVFLTLGTGVGGGVIMNNKVYEGTTGAAAEFGHFVMDLESHRVCGCGLKGCLETIVSATGIANVARDMIEKTSFDTVLNDIVFEDITAKDVFDAAKEQDIVALEVVEKVTATLALAITYINLTVNPEVVIIGGGVSKAGDILIHEIQKNYVGLAMHPVRDVKFKIAELENDAGMYGAAYLIHTL